jgi:hypothetical protein
VTDLKEALLYTSISPISMQILFPYIAVALTALITVFHHSGLKRRFGDAKGMWLYFVFFFLFSVAVPTLIIVVVEPNPLQVLSDLGADPGNYKVGVLLMLPETVPSLPTNWATSCCTTAHGSFSIEAYCFSPC